MRVKSKMCMIGHRAAGRSRTGSLGITLVSEKISVAMSAGGPKGLRLIPFAVYKAGELPGDPEVEESYRLEDVMAWCQECLWQICGLN